MSKKYFVFSDVHSFKTPLLEALNIAGFDKKNPEHCIIMCGDLFDRGNESKELLKFIKSIPKERRVLIRGNHEYLLRDLLQKPFPDPHDVSNGTVRTVMQLAGYEPWDIGEVELFARNWYGDGSLGRGFDLPSYIIDWWIDARDKVKRSKLIYWIFKSDEWVDYYELNKFIFVHAFIPVINPTTVDMYWVNPKVLEYDYGWRYTLSSEFEESTWGCPWRLFKTGLFNKEIKDGKVLVCGHWHSYGFREAITGKQYNNAPYDVDNFGIFYSDHLIALDATTVFSGTVNVMVIEDGKCYDVNHKELTPEVSKETLFKFCGYTEK